MFEYQIESPSHASFCGPSTSSEISICPAISALSCAIATEDTTEITINVMNRIRLDDGNRTITIAERIVYILFEHCLVNILFWNRTMRAHSISSIAVTTLV